MTLRGWIVPVMLAALVGCSQRREPELVFVDLEAGDPYVATLFAEGVDPQEALRAAFEARGVPLSFWAENVPPELVRHVSEHPCGSTLTVLLKRLPTGEEAVFLIPERVVEIDAAGRVLAEWRMPIDSTVVAVDGDAIIVAHPVGFEEQSLVVGLSIARDGALMLVDLPDPRAESCPCPPLPSFGGSDYLECWRFEDAAGRQRFIAYQGPCS